MALGHYLSTDEAAEVMGVSPGRVRQLIAEGRLMSRMEGRKRWVLREDAQAWRPNPPGRPRERGGG